ncbi:MAG: efflux RND transporter periplasmic adaptor subunit [Verrucomicrobiota bacterium]
MLKAPHFIYSMVAVFLVLSGTGRAGGAKLVDGITEPFLDVTLASPVHGIIAREHFKEGDEVKEGQVILDLDQKIEELEVTRRKEIAKRAKADMESTRTLLATTKAVSRDEMEKREMEHAVAVVDEGVALEQLRRRQIAAPFRGTIAEMLLQRGAGCEPYQHLVRLVDTRQCYFVGYVQGVLASELKVGQTVRVDTAGLSFKATLSFISPTADPASGLTKVKALFENEGEKLRPGMASKMVIGE